EHDDLVDVAGPGLVVVAADRVRGDGHRLGHAAGLDRGRGLVDLALVVGFAGLELELAAEHPVAGLEVAAKQDLAELAPAALVDVDDRLELDLLVELAVGADAVAGI